MEYPSFPGARARNWNRAAVAAAMVFGGIAGLSGCGMSVPSDPNGTLQHVMNGELRVGISPDPGLVEVDAGAPSGSVVHLVTAFADSLNADVSWRIGTEESLVRLLEEGKLDLVAGGITTDTPWVDKVGVTRGYESIPGADGRTLVMLTEMGENAFISRLEAFLDSEVVQ